MNIKENPYIVLVNYCNAGITVDCINSLKIAGVKSKQIIVVDNNSPDDSIQILEKVEGIVLIKSQYNGGFSYGNNLGIIYALEHDCSSVILLNNDTVVDDKFFEKIFDCEDGIVAVPKIYFYSNPSILWYAGGKIDYLRGRQVHFGEGKEDSLDYSYRKQVDYASGCCMMLPRSVIDKVGLLDEQYFMYWEDMDYSLRLRNAGIIIQYLPDAKIWHKVGMSGGSQSKMAIYYSNRNRFYILKQYHFGLIAIFYTFVSRSIRFCFGLLKRNNDYIIGKAWHDFRKGNMGKADTVL